MRRTILLAVLMMLCAPGMALCGDDPNPAFAVSLVPDYEILPGDVYWAGGVARPATATGAWAFGLEIENALYWYPGWGPEPIPILAYGVVCSGIAGFELPASWNQDVDIRVHTIVWWSVDPKSEEMAHDVKVLRLRSWFE